MGIDLPLADMSVDNKLQAMELLWADLSQNPEQLAAPAWHGAVLSSRRDPSYFGRDCGSPMPWDQPLKSANTLQEQPSTEVDQPMVITRHGKAVDELGHRCTLRNPMGRIA